MQTQTSRKVWTLKSVRNSRVLKVLSLIFQWLLVMSHYHNVCGVNITRAKFLNGTGKTKRFQRRFEGYEGVELA